MIGRPHMERLRLLFRTVRHLRPAQIGHRLRLRGQKSLYRAAPGVTSRVHSRPVGRMSGWPVGYIPLDGRLDAAGYPDATANAEGVFEFLGEQRPLGSPHDWNPPTATQLWRYHLHYMDWAWSFVAVPDRRWGREAFVELWQSWGGSTVFGRWDAWSPYVASVRVWNLCGIHRELVAGSDVEPSFIQDLQRHGRFVRANLERDVGGNHLLKNLKGLLGVGVFLDVEPWVVLALTELRRQLAVQVLADGGHYELSPSYHCQVLGDLIDIEELLRSSGRAVPDELDEAVSRMRTWLGEMLLPDGDVPLFNDCTLVGATRLALLQPTPSLGGSLTLLADSGYVVMRPSPQIHLVADVGPPCPAELPAHAHADCLSFVLSVDGRRVIVDTGTSTYQAGEIRQHERATRAHNTVEVGGVDQTEVWGAFRAARRATPRLEEVEHHGGTIELLASHDGYLRLPGSPRHRRRWVLTASRLVVTDEISSGQPYAVASRLHLAPGIDVTSEAHPGRFEAGVLDIAFTGGAVELVGQNEHAEVPTAWRAGSFGRREPVAVLAQRATGRQITLTVRIEW